MSDPHTLVIAPLNNVHHRPAFQCGVASLDRYLHTQAKQDIKRRISRVFVATSTDKPTEILGYYTLSSLSIELIHLPESHLRKLPKHPIPAALIGRLAVSQQSQGKGIGKMLLANALQRTLSVSHEIAIYTLVVDAINERAHRFYHQFGFISLTAKPGRLFLPLG